jgi:FtsH-binding integral membrane protein
VEQPQIELIVRLTARMSAAAFATALLLFSFSGGPHPRRIRRALQLLWAFVAAHTIHFGFVVWLAALTNGANIDDRGGWPLMVIVAALFYGSSFAILRLWHDVGSHQHAASEARPGAYAGVVFIAVVFLNSYLARVEDMPVYWLATIGMIAAVAVYFVRASVVIAPHQ